MKKLLFVFCIILYSLKGFARDPLPPNLISLDSKQGGVIFGRSYRPNYFWPLGLYFVTQKTQTYCSIASSVMVLNALKIKSPLDVSYAPYRIFTQDNFFTPAVKKIISIDVVKKQGATLKQIAAALETFSVKTKIVYADTLSAETFRTILKKSLNNNAYIIVNFNREGLAEAGGGHMSPVGGYDAKSDLILILDVSRYRYPPVWVKTKDLLQAMRMKDSKSKRSRGLVIVSYRQ